MSRPLTEYIYAQVLEWTGADGLAGREGLPTKRLSHDGALGELTAVVSFPPGWRGSVQSGFQEEVYVLEGELAVDGRALARDGYFRVPASTTHDWSSSQGAVAILFLNAAAPEDARDLVVVDTVAMEWDRSGVPVELQFMGIARKALFADADSGRHRTWLLSVSPQIRPTGRTLRVETHPCAEELFMLAGDITGPQGAMTAGAYFWRPAEVYHGPYGSRSGGLALCRFRHGVQDVVFHDQTLPFAFEAPYRPDLPPERVALANTAPSELARF